MKPCLFTLYNVGLKACKRIEHQFDLPEWVKISDLQTVRRLGRNISTQTTQASASLIHFIKMTICNATLEDFVKM